MCGITGAVWSESRLALSHADLNRMTGMLRHRGPDAEGAYTSAMHFRPPYGTCPGVALGHRRLSVIDVAGSRQPLANEDGTVWVVFNGEIYNFRELRRRLEGSGHVFRTQGDTETLVHLYEEQGEALFEQLIGMFALAIWDDVRGRLVLGRDRLGQKPLVYRAEPGRLLFASELKSLLALSDVPREIDPGAVDAYLTFQYVPHPQTIYRGTLKLPPAHYAVYENGRMSVRRYWSPSMAAAASRRQRPKAGGGRTAVANQVESIRQAMETAVRRRMLSDVPLGAFLSGGVDSSVVVALMQAASSEPVKTFSIGFQDQAYDESAHARRVARHVGTDHHELIVEPSAVRLLDRLVWHYDEPFADSSAVPTYLLAEFARRQVTVALTGDGGDELFAGYPRYRAVWAASLADRLPKSMRAAMASRVWQYVPAGGRERGVLRRAKRFSAALAADPVRRYGQWIAIFPEALRAELYSDDFLAALPDRDPLLFLQEAFAAAKSDPIVARMMETDLVTYLPCDLMTKVDIASMAVGLECRQPFLDHELVDSALALPLAVKWRAMRPKWILRKAFADLLPSEVFRRRKMGFGVPLARWFREDLRELAHDVLLDATSLGRGYFRPQAVERLLAEHQQGRRDHAYRLWSLLIFELWLRSWHESPGGREHGNRSGGRLYASC